MERLGRGRDGAPGGSRPALTRDAAVRSRVQPDVVPGPHENNASAPSRAVGSQARSVQGNHRRRRLRRVCGSGAWTSAHPPESGSVGTWTAAEAVVTLRYASGPISERSAGWSTLFPVRPRRETRLARYVTGAAQPPTSSASSNARRSPAWVWRARRRRARGRAPQVLRGPPVPRRRRRVAGLREVVVICGEPAHPWRVRVAARRLVTRAVRWGAPARRSAQSTACSA